MRLKPTRNKALRAVNLGALAVIAVVLGVVTCVNLFQTDRPTYSESEKRPLATFPTFSFASLADGSFFRGLNDYVSDTFPMRERLVEYSGKIKTLMGVEGKFVIIDVGPTQSKDTEAVITIPPVTRPPVSTPPETDSGTNPDSGDVTDVTDPIPVTVTALSLSSNTLTLETGGAGSLTVTVQPIGLDDVVLEWTSSNASVATPTPLGKLGCSVNGVAPGTAVITVRTPNGVTATCNVTVTTQKAVSPGEVDVLPTGFFIYDNAVYSIPYYGENASTSYANVIKYWGSLFPDATVSAMIIPLSSGMLDSTVYKGLTDQNGMIEKTNAKMLPKTADDPTNMNPVNCFAELRAHRDEYLYFRTDHHWTNRGAYYAYRSFILSRGMTPTELSSMKETLISDSYLGSMYTYTKDERVKGFLDKIYGYLPTKEHTMTVTTSLGAVREYNCAIVESYHSYLSFITGDNAFVHIHVPDNPEDKKIIVVKDSYGNAFVPYLVENFSDIYVIDPRWTKFNVYDMYKDEPISDILFVNHIFNSNGTSWAQSLLACVS